MPGLPYQRTLSFKTIVLSALFRKSVAAGIQSRARKQADSELVIGLPCPLPQELSKNRFLQKRDPLFSIIYSRKSHDFLNFLQLLTVAALLVRSGTGIFVRHWVPYSGMRRCSENNPRLLKMLGR